MSWARPIEQTLQVSRLVQHTPISSFDLSVLCAVLCRAVCAVCCWLLSQVVKDELGAPWYEIYADLTPEPIAAASLVRGVWWLLLLPLLQLAPVLSAPENLSVGC